MRNQPASVNRKTEITDAEILRILVPCVDHQLRGCKCVLCAEVMHQWGEWSSDSDRACVLTRVCGRCQETESREAEHKWEEIEEKVTCKACGGSGCYAGPDPHSFDNLLICYHCGGDCFTTLRTQRCCHCGMVSGN